MSDATETLSDLRRLVQQFVDERDWGQFHAPKNLAMALAIEAAEVMEHFQWLDVADSAAYARDPAQKQRVAEELADVCCYLLSLVNVLELDLSDAVRAKLAKNARKYPVELSRGRFDAPAGRPAT
ncbi:MAG: nucleotide pyrophosphohydrolase [Planctomycetaceae bacterium]